MRSVYITWWRIVEATEAASGGGRWSVCCCRDNVNDRSDGLSVRSMDELYDRMSFGLHMLLHLMETRQRSNN